MGLPFRLPLILVPALTLGAALQEPPAPEPPTPEPARQELGAQELSAQELAPRAATEPLYSLSVQRQDAEATIMAFARRAGINVVFMDKPTTLLSLVFKDLPFEHAFKDLLAAAELTYRKLDGDYVVGSTLDMRLRFPDGADKILDATYRCRRIDAASLVKSLRSLFPSDLAMALGPLYLTPPLEGGQSYGERNSGKPLSLTNDSFRTHDVVFSGPPELVRRALTLARKFDRPRKMARIIVKIVEVTSTKVMNLGVDWADSLGLAVTEQSNVAMPSGSSYGSSNDPSPTTPKTAAANLVDGIRVGRFSHTPLVVNATLNALEVKGYVKTLANPTILLLDGERSYIQAGNKYVYPSFKYKDDSGQSIYDTKEANIGIYLQVGLQMGLDNDLTLSLFPQVTFSNGKNVVNGAEYPIIGTREEQTTVRATSGQMIVLGGLLQDDRAETRNGIPFLSRIPLLGYLFSSNFKNSVKTELMLFVTPEIVDDAPATSNVDITVKGKS
jgi:type II secretory pathway component GspD/PulD (secretin)